MLALFRGTGDVLVSRSLARSLQIAVGDEVSVTDGNDSPATVRVSGIIANPADASARTVQMIGEPRDLSAATRWVSDQDLSSEYPELTPYLSGYTAVTTTAKVVKEASLENLPPSVSALTFVPIGGGVIVLVLIACVAAALTRTWSRDVDALQAAGVRPARGWRTIATTVTVLVLTGALLGAVIALGVLNLARSSVSGLLGHDWVTVSTPFLTIAGLVVSVVLLGWAVVPLSRRMSTTRARTPRTFRLPGWRRHWPR
ncbi:MAG: hypothetical protein QM695_14780 [Micropruina sp.]